MVAVCPDPAYRRNRALLAGTLAVPLPTLDNGATGRPHVSTFETSAVNPTPDDPSAEDAVVDESTEPELHDFAAALDPDLAELGLTVSVSNTVLLDLERDLQEWLGRDKYTVTLAHNDLAIGVAELQRFNREQTSTMFLDGDNISTVLEATFNALVDGEEEGNLDDRPFQGLMEDAQTLVVVDRFWVDPAWQGRGLEEAFLWRAIGCVPDNLIVVATYPLPPEGEVGSPEAWTHARRFWTGAQFVHYTNGIYIGAYTSYMVCWWSDELDRKLADWKRLMRTPLPGEEE